MKEIKYAPIPEFDQFTQFVRQQNPVDMGDFIHVGVDVVSANLDEAVEKSLTIAEEFATVQDAVKAGATNSVIGAAFKVASAKIDAIAVDVKPIAEEPPDIKP
jgi:hypothetical protein